MIKRLRAKLGQSIEDLDDERVQKLVADLGVTPIAEAPARTRVVLAGEVQGLQVVTRGGSFSLEVTVGDGSGRAIAVFTGRRRLPGMDPGRRVILEGVGRRERGRLLVVNPAYTLVE